MFGFYIRRSMNSACSPQIGLSCGNNIPCQPPAASPLHTGNEVAANPIEIRLIN